MVPVAKQNGSMERDYWQSSARRVSDLESPEAVGKRAAERALRRLNPRKVPTQKVPVIFEPRTARMLVGRSLRCGQRRRNLPPRFVPDRKAGREDRIGSADHHRRRHHAGTCSAARPFDDEGVTSRRTVVIERGVLKSYLLNTYTALKLGLKTTGNASRGLAGSAGVGPGNFYIEAGTRSEARSDRRRPPRPLRHGADRRVGQHRDRRLFFGRRRPVD